MYAIRSYYDPVAVALVADVGDPVDALVAHQLGDLLDQPRLVHLVRQLVDRITSYNVCYTKLLRECVVAMEFPSMASLSRA